MPMVKLGKNGRFVRIFMSYAQRWKMLLPSIWDHRYCICTRKETTFKLNRLTSRSLWDVIMPKIYLKLQKNANLQNKRYKKFTA